MRRKNIIAKASAGHQPISGAMYPFSTRPGKSFGIKYFHKNFVKNSPRMRRPMSTPRPMITFHIGMQANTAL